MPKIKFLPLGLEVTAQPGESILECALNNDVPLQHACGGFCACTTCHVHVIHGAENLSPVEEDEKERLESTADELAPNSRLGCQAKIQGDVEVRMVHLD